MSEAPSNTKKPAADTAEAFVGSVFKFSIAAIASFVMYGLAMVLADVFVPDKAIYGEITQFLKLMNSIMTIAIFGLDQSFIRFGYEPPGKLDSKGLFRLCFYLSSTALVVGALVCCLFFAAPLHSLFNFEILGPDIIPLAFLNAFFWMVARYFYLLFRMEQSLMLYTVTAILQNFFYKLFYLFGAFFENQLAGMVLFTTLGLGALALFCFIVRRKALLPRKGDLDRTAIKTILPYGAASAPTAIMVTLNTLFSMTLVSQLMDSEARGIYGYGDQLSNVITAVQLGFASFWAAYMFANYKTQQRRIQRVHDYLNLLIFGFFAVMVAAEDILFWVLGNSRNVQIIFPIMMLSAVFNVTTETTVYGNAIARKPIFDTIGNGIALGGNLLLCWLLVPRFGLVGAAMALAGANLAAFLFRTAFSQHFYRSIPHPLKTVAAFLLAIALAFAGTYWAYDFLPRFICSAVVLAIYCVMYRKEFVRYIGLGMGILRQIINKLFKKTAT